MMTNQSCLRRPNGDGFYFRYYTSDDFFHHGTKGLPTVEVRLDYNGNRYTGCAWCSPHDAWSPEVGRKVALARALSQIPRPARRPFWSMYFARSPRYERQLRRCLRPFVLAASQGDKPCASIE